MYCSGCGTQLASTATFCAACGQSLAAAPLVPSEGRIAGHIRLLGILWLALSALRLVPGLAVLLIAGTGMAFLPPEVPVPQFVLVLLPILGGIFLLGAVLGIVTGWGLLVRAPWARILAIVGAFLNLMDIPLGTALGVYTLWVLLPAQSEREYHGSVRAA